MNPKYSAVLLETPGHDLILHHRDNKPNVSNPDKVGVFGGGVEDSETYEQAAVRELQEELGLNITEKELEHFLDYQKNFAQHGIDQDCRVFIVRNVDPNKLQMNPEEGQGIVIVSKTQNMENIDFTVMARDLVAKHFKL